MAAVSGRHVMFASVRALAHSYAPGDGAREGRFMNTPVRRLVSVKSLSIQYVSRCDRPSTPVDDTV